MRFDIRPSLALLVITASGCASGHGASRYIEVSLGQLVEHPRAYQGRRIRVGGFLVFHDRVAIMDPVWPRCYGDEAERRFLMTDLPQSAVTGHRGPVRLADMLNNGRRVVVVGVFRDSRDPWPRSSIVEAPVFRAVGPLRHTQIVELDDRGCDPSIEGPD